MKKIKPLTKKDFSLIIFFSFSFFFLSAQNPLFPGIRNLKRTIIVKDSTGRIVPDREWMTLTTTYKYKFSRTDSTGEELVYNLVRMTEEDKKEIFKNVHPELTSNFVAGDTIAAFKLKDMEGTPLKYEELKGKIMVLYFCILESPATRYEAKELNALATKFQNRSDVIFIAIARESKGEVKDFIKKTGFNFHIVPNAQSTMDKYDISAWPAHVVIDKKGKVYLHIRNYNPELSVFWVNQAIDEIAAKDDNAK